MVLDSPDRLLIDDYERALVGMIRGDVPTFDALLKVRSQLHQDILTGLADSDRVSLTGFHNCEPAWSLLPYPHASELPALMWKPRNLEIFHGKRPDELNRQHTLLVELLA